MKTDHNPANSPELWPIETYWAQMKKIWQENLRSCSKMDEITKNCTLAQNKLSNTFVQNLMKGVKAKVRKFGRLKIKKSGFRVYINRKHVRLSDNVKKLFEKELP